jgi:protein involved in polysaccharide export with SLBB domain
MPPFFAVFALLNPLTMFRALAAPEAGSTLEVARLGGGESVQRDKNPLRVAVTVSEAAGHHATIPGPVEKPGVYDAHLEEPLTDGMSQEGEFTATANHESVVDNADMHGWMITANAWLGVPCIS